MTANLIPAAQYLRMSTEHQQYSLENQGIAIKKYAELNGFNVVQTYEDPARSGLVLKNRDGLRQLLNDVVTGGVVFKSILVYDVSRWGRFQDTDEAAHYEFICRSAGIPVHYCAEQFTNDGSVVTALMKTFKRTMAAEYAREMGVKIAAGQQTVYMKGFRGHGSLPGFGLRRMLVSPDGTPKQLLARGELKALHTDRVILVPGPPDEVDWVREIFRLFIVEKFNYREIAEILNANGVDRDNHRPWNFYAVRYLLSNTKYNGRLTYGMWTRRLHTKCRKNPESQWLVAPHPTSKIIDDETFAAARSRIRAFTINKSDDEMLDELRGILAANGKLSTYYIRSTPGATSPFSIRCRFGSLLKAFQRIGYTAKTEKQIGTRRRIRDMQLQLLQKLQQMFPEELEIHGNCGPGKSNRKWLQTREGAKISVRVCGQVPNIRWKPAWRLNHLAQEYRWTALVAFLNRQNTEIQRLVVFPSVPKRRWYLASDDPWLKKGIELHDFKDFFQIVTQTLAVRRFRRKNARPTPDLK